MREDLKDDDLNTWLYSSSQAKLFETCYQSSKRVKTDIKYHKHDIHDNAPWQRSTHVTKTVKDCLNQAGITVIRYPPYWPDLALSNFWLFDLIKHRLDDHVNVRYSAISPNQLLSKSTYKEFNSELVSEIVTNRFEHWI